MPSRGKAIERAWLAKLTSPFSFAAPDYDRHLRWLENNADEAFFLFRSD
jgi:hypothetical protein